MNWSGDAGQCGSWTSKRMAPYHTAGEPRVDAWAKWVQTFKDNLTEDAIELEFGQ